MGLFCKFGKHNYGDGCVCKSCKATKKVKDLFDEKALELMRASSNERVAMHMLNRELKAKYEMVFDAAANPETTEMSLDLAKAMADMCWDALRDTTDVGKTLYVHIYPFLNDTIQKAKACMQAYGYEYKD